MSKLEFVGTKIPSEWIQKLKQLTKETGETQSSFVRDAIAAAIGVNQKTKVNPLRDELDDLKARVQALEQLTRLTPVVSSPIAVAKSPARPTSSIKPSTPCTGALTTGEILPLLQGRGYPKGIAMLRRSLRRAIELGQLPDDLAAMGIRADFETRRSGNPKDNSLRWLFVDHPS